MSDGLQISTASSDSTNASDPQPITIADLLNSIEVIKQKELIDKGILESIGNMSYEDLKQRLLLWATSGFVNLYEINRITIVPPEKCSDGIVRDLTNYIQYCSGKTIQEHIEILANKVSGINITFANFGLYIAILVSRYN